jgi:hypothetical protein
MRREVRQRRRQRIPVSDEQLAADYKAGLTQRQIREKYAMDAGSVVKRLKALGFNRPRVSVGERYGKWLIVRPAKKDAKGRVFFWCQCDCGTLREVWSGNLLDGGSRSCGCAAKQAQKEKFTLPNNGAAINSLFYRYQRGADRRGHAWALSSDLFGRLIQEPCHYCGKTESNTQTCANTGKVFRYNGIDRADNSLGYLPDNVVPCCKVCNVLKGTRDASEFIEWARAIAARHGGGR